jgi:hypothetical protein
VDHFTTMVECVLPAMSPVSGRAVRALISLRGQVASAEGFACSIGLRNRDQLRRSLAADGLPCLEDLAGWIRVLGWVIDAEQGRVSLSASALRAGKDPRSWYRTVQRLTGKTWGHIRVRGSAWVLAEMMTAIVRPISKTKAGSGAGSLGALSAQDHRVSA